MLMTMSLSVAASLADEAGRMSTVVNFCSSSALRSNAVTSWPPRAMLDAIGAPMVPVPIKPMRMRFLPSLWLAGSNVSANIRRRAALSIRGDRMKQRLERIEARVYRAAISAPVRTSFGVMRDRPAVLVRVVDSEGAEGWGEVWCNFPSVGAEHRARLLRDVIAPVALEEGFDTPAEL